MFRFVVMSAACLSLVACAVAKPEQVLSYSKTIIAPKKYQIKVSATSEDKARSSANEVADGLVKSNNCKSFVMTDGEVSAQKEVDHYEIKGNTTYNPYNAFAGLLHKNTAYAVYKITYNYTGYAVLKDCAA